MSINGCNASAACGCGRTATGTIGGDGQSVQIRYSARTAVVMGSAAAVTRAGAVLEVIGSSTGTVVGRAAVLDAGELVNLADVVTAPD